MPRLRKSKSELRKVGTRIDEVVFKKMNEAMDKLGVESKAEFLRMAVVEKIKKVLRSPLMAFLPLILPADVLSVLSALLLSAFIIYYVVKLVRGESPEEQARAWRVLTGCVLGGVLMAIAKPLAEWATGIDFENPSGNIPVELTDAVKRLLDMLMYIGVVVIIGGIIYGGIQLARKKSKKTV